MNSCVSLRGKKSMETNAIRFPRGTMLDGMVNRNCSFHFHWQTLLEFVYRLSSHIPWCHFMNYVNCGGGGGGGGDNVSCQLNAQSKQNKAIISRSVFIV